MKIKEIKVISIADNFKKRRLELADFIVKHSTLNFKDAWVLSDAIVHKFFFNVSTKELDKHNDL